MNANHVTLVPKVQVQALVLDAQMLGLQETRKHMTPEPARAHVADRKA